MIGGLGPTELIIILVIALIIFGPSRLAGIGGALGKAIRDFQRSLKGVDDEVKKVKREIKEELEEKE